MKKVEITCDKCGEKISGIYCKAKIKFDLDKSNGFTLLEKAQDIKMSFHVCDKCIEKFRKLITDFFENNGTRRIR
jgi:hypothetical protein